MPAAKKGGGARKGDITPTRNNKEATRTVPPPHERAEEAGELVAMARSPRSKGPRLWMNGSPVGMWERLRDGEQLTYFKEWIAQTTGSRWQRFASV